MQNAKNFMPSAAAHANKDMDNQPVTDAVNSVIEQQTKDIKNIGTERKAGTILAGIFLKKFVDGKYPWAHIDIAGTSMNVSNPTDYMTPGANGYGVRLFVELLKNMYGH